MLYVSTAKWQERRWRFFFNIPILQCLGLITQGQKKTGNLFSDSPLKSTACRNW